MRLLLETSGVPRAQAEALVLDEEDYRTPKVNVRGAMVQDDRILHVKEKVAWEPRCMEETSVLAFFSRGALPALSIRRMTAEQILLLFTHWQNRNRPTDFDSSLPVNPSLLSPILINPR
jgi:hypothetical protein